MKLHILSDLHLSQAGFAPPATDADLVILAGDIARPPEAVAWARSLGKPVLYVPGNHEFYGGSLDGTVAQLRALCAGSDVHLLHEDEFRWEGVRFLGTTLWTDFELFGDEAQRAAAEEAASRFMRDFQRIRVSDGAPALLTPRDSAAMFDRHAAWLAQRLDQPFDGATVVITHHAPSPRSVHPRFEGSPVNACFVSRAEHLLGGGRAALWVHGHTHDSFDYLVDGTRVLCNPRGYRRNEVDENANFDPGLVVNVG
ncbi:metallophosphoesterase [Ramlibacter sp. G-1-2-2]|uniref:Metallophosphoesterase n=1 Tax=Ramlibacter agri TaxID=2728837 RepID=A0A848H9Z4_9BURK|nr:metallophosphoesterase [Ramlibacter agri]NML46329.1 metallophosphoesterase [Ramlibacter agri]